MRSSRFYFHIALLKAVCEGKVYDNEDRTKAAMLVVVTGVMESYKEGITSTYSGNGVAGDG